MTMETVLLLRTGDPKRPQSNPLGHLRTVNSAVTAVNAQIVTVVPDVHYVLNANTVSTVTIVYPVMIVTNVLSVITVTGVTIGITLMNYRIEDDWVIDEDDNRASLQYWGSFEQAINSLRTLIRCTNCENCVHCYECLDCIECNTCNNCWCCVGCDLCIRCIERKDCSSIKDPEN